MRKKLEELIKSWEGMRDRLYPNANKPIFDYAPADYQAWGGAMLIFIRYFPKNWRRIIHIGDHCQKARRRTNEP